MMVKKRIIETNACIQDGLTVETFDRFARVMRDKGWNGVDSMLASGIQGGIFWAVHCRDETDLNFAVKSHPLM